MALCWTRRALVSAQVLLVVLAFPGVSSQPFTTATTYMSVSVEWGAGELTNIRNFTIFLNGVPKRTIIGGEVQSGGFYTMVGLGSGDPYTIKVETYSNTGLLKVMLNETVVTNPQMPRLILPIPNTDVTLNSITVRWEEPLGSNQSQYKVYYRDQASQGLPIVKPLQAPTTSYTLDSLLPGHLYDINITAISYGVASLHAYVDVNTAPGQPNISSIQAIDTHTLEVTWSPQTGSNQSGFVVTYEMYGTNQPMEAPGCGRRSCVIKLNKKTADAGQQFAVKVYAVQRGRRSSPAYIVSTTKPKPAVNLTLQSRQTDSLTISWGEPQDTSFTTFDIDVDPDEGSKAQPAKTNKVWTYTRNGLQSGKMYRFLVFTVSGKSVSTSAYIDEYTKPPAPSVPVRGSQGTTSKLHMVWNQPIESGNFEKYRLTISKAGTRDVIEGRPVEVAATIDRSAEFSGLTPGAKYIVKMMTVIGGNIYSDPVSAPFTIKPLAPEDIDVVLRTRDQLKVKWSLPPAKPLNEFTGFTVEVRSLQGSRKNLAYPSTLEASFSRLNPGTLYTIDVKTVSGNQFSDAKSGSFYTMPNPPSNLHQVAVTNSTITVEWNPPIASGTRGYDAYTIYIRNQEEYSAEVHLEDNARTTTFSDLQPGTQYTIRLVSSIGGTLSEQRVINVLTKPYSPQNLRVVSKSTESLTVHWSAPSRGKVDAYLIKFSTQSVAASSLPQVKLQPNQLEFSQDGLTAGVTYTVNVFVEISTRESDRTEQSYPAVLAVTMNPLAPSRLDVTYTGTTSVEVQWDEPNLNLVFDAYEVVVMQGSTLITTEQVLSETKTKNIGNLRPGEQYQVSVYTMSNGERSAAISRDFATLNRTEGNDTDSAPVGVATIEPVRVSTMAIEIQWTKPSGTGFNHYELSIAPNDGNLPLPASVDKNAELGYAFRNLNPGVSYNISIQVVANLDSLSQPFSRVISTKPSSVIDLQTAALSTSTIQVRWNIDRNSKQSNFIVTYRNIDAQSETVKRDVLFVPGLTAYNTQLTDLAAGSTYLITVLAVSNDIQSDSLQKTQTTKPKQVQDVTVMAKEATMLRITWETAADSRQNAYIVRYRGLNTPVDSMWRTEQTAAKAVVLTGLFPGERYQIEISARSADQTSATTTTSRNTYPLPPEKLTVDRASTTTSSIRVTWVYDSDKTFIKQLLLRYAIQGLSQWQEEYISSLTDNTKVLYGLDAGQKYIVQVYGVTDFDIASITPIQVNATVKPELTTQVSKNDAASNNDTITIRYTDNRGEFDHYLFSIDVPARLPVAKDKDDNTREVRFTGLQAGHTYTITVKTISGDVSSEAREYIYTTKPNTPEVIPNQEQSSIRLTIMKPAGLVDRYNIECVPQGLYPCEPANRTVDVVYPSVDVLYNNLRPYSNYRFTVKAVKGNEHSTPLYVSARTQEAPPGKVKNLTHVAASLKPYEVTLTWQEPLERNGDIKGYRISYNGTRPGRPFDSSQQLIELDSKTLMYTFTNLKAGYTYIFTVQAVTVDAGDRTIHQIKMPVGSPHVVLEDKESRPRRVNSTVTYNKFMVELIDPFSDQNGEVVEYVILVTTDINDPLLIAQGDIRFQNWKEFIDRDGEGTYQAIQRCPDLFSPHSTCGNGVQWMAVRRRALNNRISFMVGNETNCNKVSSGYCNGPVLPSKKYYVKLRGYTETGMWADSPLSDGITTVKAPMNTVGVGMIIVIVILIVLVILFILIIIFILVRRGTICAKKDEDGKQPKPGNLGLGQLRFSSRRKKHGAETSRPVKISDFGEHVRVMSADSDFKFSEEYEDLKPVGREQTTNAAEFPVNRNKNRFTNILPYDHSRVKLLPTDDEEGSDYINANYMPGYNSKRQFIVTQGPLPSTRDDFWRMVWEQNSRAIVMLTKCVEKGREKCDHYWPVDSEPMFYGDLQVVVLNETKCPEWIVTEFRISKGEQSRNLKHFHYIAWPDFGVPERPQSLIRFVRLVRSKVPPDSGPIIAHCSAGVGRSGAFIAVDWLLLMLKEKSADSIDIFSLVYQMRQNRPQMVQTEQQYICIHHCLLCVVEGEENDPSPYTGLDNEAYDESPTHTIYNSVRPVHPNDDDEGITLDMN